MIPLRNSGVPIVLNLIFFEVIRRLPTNSPVLLVGNLQIDDVSVGRLPTNRACNFQIQQSFKLRYKGRIEDQ